MITQITYTTDRDKFGSTDDDIMTTVDKKASLDRLAQMWLDRLGQSYPDAKITIKWADGSPTGRIDALDEAGDYVERNSMGNDIENIQFLVDEVWLGWFDQLVYNS